MKRSIDTLKPIPLKKLTATQEKRRAFLKYGLFGVSSFMAGKVFGPSLSLLGGMDFGKVTDFENFRVIETKEGLRFFDRFGNEVLTLDKEV